MTTVPPSLPAAMRRDTTEQFPEQSPSVPGTINDSVPRSSGTVSGTPEHATDTLAVDLAAIAEGRNTAPSPTILHRTDTRALLYPGRVNVIQGDPESGKTWLLLCAVEETLRADRSAAFVDLDHNGPHTILSHLTNLGRPLDVLTDVTRFRYYCPEDRWQLLDVVEELAGWNAALVGFDSMGEILPMMGASSNDADDFSNTNRQVFTPIANRGAALAVIDHLAKGRESRQFGASGTAAKQRSPDGAVIRVTAASEYAPGRGGSSLLEIWKDRAGGVRQHCPPGSAHPSCGTFHLHAEDDDRLSWSIAAPTGQERPSTAALADRNADELADLDPPPESVRDIKARLGWGSDKATAALKAYRERSAVPDTVPPERGTLIGPCIRCDQPTQRYGDGGSVFCDGCRDQRKEDAK